MTPSHHTLTRMKHYHPQKNDHGQLVEIAHPSTASDLAAWKMPDTIATTVPKAGMPSVIAGIAIAPWANPPAFGEEWDRLAAATAITETPLQVQAGKKAASGAVVVEPDGRVWVVSPTNRFGGYQNTFPKGKLEAGGPQTLKGNALKEVFEETGLRVELVDVLCDSERSTTTTRYFLARRIGGTPSDMGWESQAIHLVPMNLLAQFASHPNDVAVIQSLLKKGI